MDRQFRAGMVAGAVLGSAITGVVGCYAVGLAGDDPTGRGRALVEQVTADRRRAEIERDVALDRLRREQIGRGFAFDAAPLTVPAPTPDLTPGDLLPPQSLPTK